MRRCAVPSLGDACLYFLTQGSNLAGLLGDGSTDAADQLVVTLRDFLERRLREGGDEATSGAKDSPLAALRPVPTTAQATHGDKSVTLTGGVFNAEREL